MRISLLCAAALVITAPLSAEARSAFYVQLGTAADEKQAQEKWEQLSAEYPAALAGLEFSPRIVSAAGGQEVRLQAGPARSRAAAQRICSGLSAKDVECFIVETAVFDGAPSIPARSFSSALTPAPAAPEAAPAPAEVAADAPASPPLTETVIKPKKSRGMFSFLFGDDEEESVTEARPAETAAETAPAAGEAPAPAGSITIPPKEEMESSPVAEGMATDNSAPLPWAETTTAKRVDVAEAIPVPLSGDRPAPLPPYDPQPLNPAPAEPKLSMALPAEVRWLQIVGFTSEQQAYDFSETLHTALHDGGSLRMRINRPLFARAASRRAVTLTVGPVSEAEMVEKICTLAEQQENQLQCAGSAEQSDVSTNLLKRGEAARPPVEAPAAPAAETQPQRSIFADKPIDSFYVMLGAWRTRNEALKRWDILKQQHAELLKGRSPDLKSADRVSINARQSVRLRVGPFMMRDEAENLCARLSARGASCITVPE